MSNPYGWSPPTNGQPPVYFAPPGQRVHVTGSPANVAGDLPYHQGFGQYPSFMDTYQPQTDDPFGPVQGGPNPFQSLSARGARQKVSMVDATMLWLKNWRNFSGRASRSEYWWVIVGQTVVQVLWWVLVVGVVQLSDLTPDGYGASIVFLGLMAVTCVAALVTTIPNLSLSIRRLHDTNHSGWYYLVQFLPFGSNLVLWALAKGSDPAGCRFDDSTQPLYGPEDLAD